jgi:glycosyltransferase involved in cell wall biosynthesis
MLDFLTSGLTDLYISNSEAGRLMTHQREHIPLSKLLTIPNGIDLAVFNPDRVARSSTSQKQSLGIEPDAPVVGIVANFRKMKGHITIIDALTRVQKHFPHIRCIFVGEAFVKEPLYGAELRQYVGQRGLDHMVIFTGARRDIPEILSLFDVFLLPSLWEGLPTSVLEAMCMKIPVVASAVGGTSEIVEDGRTGLLIPPQNPIALADAILSLLNDPTRAKEMGQAGYERVCQAFSLSSVVARTEDVYEQVIKKCSKANELSIFDVK